MKWLITLLARLNQAKIIDTTCFVDKVVLTGLSLVKIGMILERKLRFSGNYTVPLWTLDSSAVHCLLSFVLFSCKLGWVPNSSDLEPLRTKTTRFLNL